MKGFVAPEIRTEIASFEKATGYKLERATHLDAICHTGMNLKGAPLEAIPSESLAILGELDLRGSHIERLPQWLSVRGDVHTAQSALTTLPERLIVGGVLYLDHSRVRALPEGLRVVHLSVADSLIREIPQGVQVEGYICTDRCLSIDPRAEVGDPEARRERAEWERERRAEAERALQRESATDEDDEPAPAPKSKRKKKTDK